MRILIVNWRDITHPWAGGAERHIHELAKRWVKSGNKVTLLCGGYPGAANHEVIDDIAIIRIGTTYSIFLLAAWYFLFRLRSDQFNIIIETSHGIPYFFKLVTRIPIILIIHHNHERLWKSEWPKAVGSVGQFLESRIVPLLYRNSPVVTLSKTTGNELKDLGYQKVKAIPPGIDPVKTKKNTTRFPQPSILYLGRLRRYKRVDLLIAEFPKIIRKVKHVRLIIAGDGQDRSRIERLVRLKKLSHRILMKGFVSETEKAELLARSWVLAFPSNIEGWGLVALEAASAGTPTVGFNVPGVSDAVRHGASGYLATNKTEFSNYLTALLKNAPLRKNLAITSKIWAGKFRWSISARDFLKTIENETAPYGQDYFSAYFRTANRRKFHPVYSLRAWYIKNILKPQHVLDVGCGNGTLVGLLRGGGISAIGVDINSVAFKTALPTVRPYLFKMKKGKINYTDRKFEAVINTDVLEHIAATDLPAFIRECARVARKYLFIDITCREDLFYINTDPTHVSKLYSREWQELLQKSLGSLWKVKRAYIIPFLHHGTFVAERVTCPDKAGLPR